MRRLIREAAFNIARRDLAVFLTEHEEELLQIFREEMHKLDEEMPDEQMFIDIKMVPLGEAIVRSALDALRRFLTEEITLEQSSKETE